MRPRASDPRATLVKLAGAVIVLVAIGLLTWLLFPTARSRSPTERVSEAGVQAASSAESRSDVTTDIMEPAVVRAPAAVPQKDERAGSPHRRLVSIHGRVLRSESSTPLPGVTVVLDRRPQGAKGVVLGLPRPNLVAPFVAALATTDDDGRFTIPARALDGRLSVKITHPGFRPWQSQLLENHRIGSDDGIDLGIIRLSPLPEISILVTSAGAPIQGAGIFCWPTRPQSVGSPRVRHYRDADLASPAAKTDGSGQARIAFTHATFDLLVVEPSHAVGWLEGVRPDSDAARPVVVELQPRRPVKVVPTLAGTALLEPCTVRVSLDEFGVCLEGRTRDGSITLPEVWRQETSGIVIKCELQNDRALLRGSRTLRAPVEPVVEVPIERRVVAAHLRWDDALGRGAEDHSMLIGLVRLDREGREEFTEQSFVTDVREREARVLPEGLLGYYAIAYAPSIGYGASDRFAGKDGAEDLELVWHPGRIATGPIVFRVLREDRAPAPGCWVRASFALPREVWPVPGAPLGGWKDPAGYPVFFERRTDSDGLVELRGVPFGPMTCEAHDATLGQAKLDGIHSRDQGEHPIVLTPGAILRGRIETRTGEARIRLDVLEVELSGHAGRNERVAASWEGEFAFSDLAEGRYRLSVTAPTEILFETSDVCDVTGLAAVDTPRTEVAERFVTVEGRDPMEVTIDLREFEYAPQLRLTRAAGVGEGWTVAFSRLTPFGKLAGDVRAYRVGLDRPELHVCGLRLAKWLVEAFDDHGVTRWWTVVDVDRATVDLEIAPSASKLELPRGAAEELRLTARCRRGTFEWISFLPEAGASGQQDSWEGLPMGEYVVQRKVGTSWQATETRVVADRHGARIVP